MTMLSNPLLLGFEEFERMIERAGKAGGGGYPPYNIERIAGDRTRPETLRITIAVAGFTRDNLDVSLEDKQLIVRGKAQDDKDRDYLYRGIASRQFSKTFLLADGIEVQAADLQNGLLAIDLVRHEPERLVRKIEIGSEKKGA
jgi:HSP20 family molecular chaperone IbpA